MNFKNVETRELATTFIALIITKKIANKEELKNMIVQAYSKDGISLEQQKSLIATLKADSEIINPNGYLKKDIQNILISGYITNELNNEDLFILSALAVKNGYMTSYERKRLLTGYKIPLSQFKKSDLKIILSELASL